MNNGYLQRVIEWRNKSKHDDTWGSTNVSGLCPYEVIDTLVKQLSEAKEVSRKVVAAVNDAKMRQMVKDSARIENLEHQLKCEREAFNVGMVSQFGQDEIFEQQVQHATAMECYNLIMDTELHHELGFTVADAIKEKFKLEV